ncbi:ABC transporter permease [Cupriavidus basilensis]|uniref:Dipeptide transport system permease protein DppB n=1 Tax=Cupriavidus basilensis TaxID=68895 RepID=A0A0C4YSG4_9BURK|nr:ABC transporter permease [Cupriavidus basilensis]AJG23561.1 Dipeptide transport system permease protein DppB [Cupriavidus basilensis]
MAFFVLRRLIATLPVLVIVAFIVFLMLRLTPGDPAAAIVGDAGTAADIARIRLQLGLDQSLAHQFLAWAARLVHGDLGESFYLKRSVSELIAQRLEPTVALAGVTITLAVLIAVPLGVLAAWRHGGWLDRCLMSFSVLGFSIPVFVVGYLMIWGFSLKLGWLPVQGYARLSEGLGAWLRQLVVPAVTLSIVDIALIARVTRAAVAEALTEDHVRTARAKGIPEYRVLIRHALANAAVPIVTVIGVGVALLVGGVVITETVFAIPGLGALTVEAILSRDYPVIQGVTLFFSFVYVLVNLLVDLSYIFFDPRIRY